MVITKRIDLSNKFFDFRYGIAQDEEGEDPGIKEEWYKHGLPLHDENGENELLKVYVPSAWSYYQNRKNFNYFGTGWFQTKIYMPEQWGIGDGKKIIMVFNGSNYMTTLWINGKKVGYHEGGFTKFWFDISKYVKFGKENLVVLRVDNRYKENRLPWFSSDYDLMNYGGIYRTLYLKVVNPVNIDDYLITNEITYNKPFGEGSEKPTAKINVRLLIKDARPRNRKFRGSLIFSVKNEELRKSSEIPIDLIKKDREYVNVSIELNDAHLWSPEDPFLYNLSFQLISRNRRELDREEIKWGIREFEAKDTEFFLNNKKITLRGINHIEDHPDVGSSLNPRLLYNDLNIIKEANVNCIRTLHHPPYKALIELADEMGFLILEDLPVYGLEEGQYNKKYLSIAQQQLWEMIHRDKTHCSVVAWILGDSCDTHCDKCRSFFSNMIKTSKELDPTRLHTISVEDPSDSKILDLVDFYAVKTYMGWSDDHYRNFGRIDDYLKSIKETLQGDEEELMKPMIISEFGAGAISGFKDFSSSHWTENYQYDLINSYIQNVMERSFYAGMCVSCFQDYRCSPSGGYLKRPKVIENKGIVDIHRNPKNSYYGVQFLYDIWAERMKSQKKSENNVTNTNNDNNN